MITHNIIRKVGEGSYKVFSHKGKPLSKVMSKEAAKKRLREIEFFKHQAQNVGVKGMKWGRRKARILKGGFVVRKFTPEWMKKKGWRKSGARTKAVKMKPVKDPHLVAVIPKKGKVFTPDVPKKLNPSQKLKLSRGMPIQPGLKPGQAFEFKKIKSLPRQRTYHFEGRQKSMFRTRLPKSADKPFSIADVKAGKVQSFTTKMKKAIRRVKLGGKFEFNTADKIDLLINCGVFLKRDRWWLMTMNRERLDTIFANFNFKVEDDDVPSRSPKGQYAKSGGTKHQIRKMNKMGIKARECSTV